jgi:hypothetical protein
MGMRLRIRWRTTAIAAAILTLTISIGVAIAKAQLQAQLDTDFTPNVARVMFVSMIRNGKRFDGSANLLVLDKAVILPFAVETNGKANLVTTSSGDLFRVQASFQDTLANLVGKPSSFILDSRFRSIFPKELNRDRKSFASAIGGEENTDNVTEDATYYYGHGCRERACMYQQSAWAIDKKTAKLVAVISTVDYVNGGSDKTNVNLDYYGVPKDRSDLPPPLETWKSDLVDWLNSAVNDDGMVDAIRGAQDAGNRE